LLLFCFVYFLFLTLDNLVLDEINNIRKNEVVV